MPGSSHPAPTGAVQQLRGALRHAKELPLVGGIAAGLTLLWLRGSLFVLDGTVAGYHWPEWLHNAWHVAHARHDRMSGFRKPLHGYFVGMLGEWMGYADAAILVSSVSATLMVLSAGVLARVLGGPAAGGLAAATLGAVPLVANAAHWGTGYPMLAATTGCALAAAALFAARPSRCTLLLLSASTCAALATEDRGALVLPWVLAMAGMGALGRRRIHPSWWVVAAVCVAAIPPSVDQALGHKPPFALSSEAKRTAQKEVVFRWLRIEPAPELVRTCAPIRVADTLEPAFFQTPCARAVLDYNSTEIAPKATYFSATFLGVALLGWVVAGPRRRRRLVWLALASGGFVWVVFAAATPMPHRYILQFVVPLSVVVPVAAGRLAQHFGRGWLAQGVASSLVVGLGLYTHAEDPHDRNGLWQHTRGDWSEAHWSKEVDLVRAHVPPDESILDCADHGINSALLPDNVVGPAPFLSPDAGFCRDWVADPTRFGAARRWVVAAKGQGLFDSGQKKTVRIDTLLAETSGWEQVAEDRNIELWVRPQ